MRRGEEREDKRKTIWRRIARKEMGENKEQNYCEGGEPRGEGTFELKEEEEKGKQLK